MTMHILRNLRISEVSSVDKAANGDARIVLYKRDPGISARKEHIFGKQDYSESDDVDATIDENADNSGDNGDERHLVERLADLIVEGGDRDGKEISREDALRWLLHDRHGQALVARMAHASKRTTNITRKVFKMPSRSTVLQSITKQAGGVVGLCKRIVKDGTSGDITEHELTALMVANAKREHPDLTDAAAFSRVFSDMSPAGETMRRAIQVAKFSHLLLVPVNVDTGDSDVWDDSEAAIEQRRQLDDAQQRRISQDTDLADTDEDEGDSGPDGDAYGKLAAKAADYRKAHPELTSEQCFAKIYTDPANKRLALRESRQNRPGG
jgi:hypothetical protein